MQDPHRFKTDKIPTLRRESGHRPHPYCSWSHPLGKRKLILSSGVSLGISTIFQGSPHAQKWLTNTKCTLWGFLLTCFVHFYSSILLLFIFICFLFFVCFMFILFVCFEKERMKLGDMEVGRIFGINWGRERIYSKCTT